MQNDDCAAACQSSVATAISSCYADDRAACIEECNVILEPCADLPILSEEWFEVR